MPQAVKKSAPRKNPFGAIHAARRDHGLDEDTYRALLKRVTNKTSLREMTGPELARVNNAIRGKSATKTGLSGPYAAKLQALWISAWNLGAVRDPSDEAMLKFIERQTGIQRTEFLRDAMDAVSVVEALKSWITRVAYVDWSVADWHNTYERNPKYKVVCAQVNKLVDLGDVDLGCPKYAGCITTQDLVQRIVVQDCGVALVRMSGKDWDRLENDLGRRLRAKMEGCA